MPVHRQDGRLQSPRVPGVCTPAATADDDERHRLECHADTNEDCGLLTLMLADVADPALGEHRSQVPPVGGGAPDVNGSRRGLEPLLEPRIADAGAEVDVFAVVEEPVVPASDPLEHVAPCEDARAGDPV